MGLHNNGNDSLYKFIVILFLGSTSRSSLIIHFTNLYETWRLREWNNFYVYVNDRKMLSLCSWDIDTFAQSFWLYIETAC